MKRKFKALITAFAVCAVSAFAVMASGCNLKDKINETRCDHVMVDGEVTKEPTCQEVGEMVKECTLCTYTETKELPKLAHTEVILEAVAATCTKSGLSQGKKCIDCGEILTAQKTVSPKGHTVVTDPAVAPTCTETGLTKGSHCHDCGTIFVPQEATTPTGHKVVELESWEATCEKDGYTGGSLCENCGEVYSGEVIPALGHSYDDGVVTKETTCEADGEKTYTCATCEGTKIEILPALGHSYNAVVTTEATCTTDGEKVYTCATCNDSYTEKISFLGHTYEDGRCTLCGEIESFEFSINNRTFVRNVEAAVASSTITTTWEEWVSFHCPIEGAVCYWDGDVARGTGRQYVCVPGSAIGVNPGICYYVLCYEDYTPVHPSDEIVDGYNYIYDESVFDETSVKKLDFNTINFKESNLFYDENFEYSPNDFIGHLLFVVDGDLFNEIKCYNGYIYFNYVNANGEVERSMTAYGDGRWYHGPKIYLWGCSTVYVHEALYDWLSCYMEDSYKGSCNHI